MIETPYNEPYLLLNIYMKKTFIYLLIIHLVIYLLIIIMLDKLKIIFMGIGDWGLGIGDWVKFKNNKKEG